MKKSFKTIAASLFAAAIIITAATACQNDDSDTTKPVIELEEPAEGEILKIGADVHFELELSDNVALHSYKVDIHDNIDNPHNHRATAADSALFSKTWTEAEFIAAGQAAIVNQKNAHIHHHHISIPSEVGGKPVREGSYHFIVYCTDINGNESFVARNVQLRYDAPDHDHDHEGEDHDHDH